MTLRDNIVSAIGDNGITCVEPVSYTHLDVYKRQIEGEINAQSLPNCTFEHLTKEDAGYKGEEFVCVFHKWGDSCFKFQINKILPDNYNEEIEKIKYAQILQDVINTSKAELKGIPLDGFGQMIRIPDLIVSKMCIRDRVYTQRL